MKKNRPLSKWLWSVSLIVVAVLLLQMISTGTTDIFTKLLDIFAPFIAGLIITFILYAPCKLLEECICRCPWRFVQKCARPVAMTVTYILFFAVITGIVWLLSPMFYDGITAFAKNLPAYYETVSAQLTEFTADGSWLAEMGFADDLLQMKDQAFEKLRTLITPENLFAAFKGVLSVTSSLLDVVMALIISVYMIAEREALRRACRSLIAALTNDTVASAVSAYSRKSASIFYRYLYGTSLDAIVIAVVMTITFFIFRLPQPVLLGCLVGLTNFIPYFGPIVGGGVAVVVALFSHNIYVALAVLACVIVIQQLDGNILQPKIVGSSVGMRPIYVLLAIAIGGGLFGFWGMLISVPLMAIAKMLVTDYIAYRNRQKELLTDTETETE